MATLRASVMGDGLHGSMGGLTFSRGRYGTVMRDRTTPRDRRTPGQQAALAEGLVTGAPAPTGQLVFTRLALRVLQADATAEVPVDPPAAPFGGDAVRVAVSASADGVAFTASAANAPGVFTELLLQPLASVHRRAYPRNYRSQGFVAFTGAGDSRTVLVSPGTYAVAVRFTLTATGQSTPALSLGVVQVEAS